MFSSNARITLLMTLLSLTAVQVRADFLTWDGGGVSTNFGHGLNWNTDVPPGLGDTALFRNGNNGLVTFAANEAVSRMMIFSDSNTTTSIVEFDLNQNNLDIANDLRLADAGPTQSRDARLTIGDGGLYVEDVFVGETDVMTAKAQLILNADAYLDVNNLLELSGHDSSVVVNNGAELDSDAITIPSSGTLDLNGGLVITRIFSLGIGGTLNINYGTLVVGGILGGNFDNGVSDYTLNATGGDAVLRFAVISAEVDFLRINSAGSEVATVELVFGANLTTDELYVGETGNGALLIKDGSDVTVGTTGSGFRVGVLSGSTGVVTQISGSVDRTSGSMHLGFKSGATGTYDISGGALNVVGFSAGAGFGAAGDGGVGTITQTGGTVTTTGESRLGAGSNGLGTYDISDGTLNLGGVLILGWNTGGEGVVNQTGGTVVSTDEIRLGNNGAATSGTYNLSGGLLEVAMLTFGTGGGGTFNFDGGTLSVDSFVGNLTQDGGTLAPGDSPGTTTINGEYDLNSGTLEAEFGGVGNPIDLVDVTGNINIALVGTSLDLVPVGGGMAAGTYTLMQTTGGTLTGMFENVTDLGIYDDLVGLQYNATSITITIDTDLLAGDFDLDGDVDGADFLVLQQCLGTIYDADDLDDWEANFGTGVPPLAASGAVPEPSTLLLGALAGIGLLLRRRCSAK